MLNILLIITGSVLAGLLLMGLYWRHISKDREDLKAAAAIAAGIALFLMCLFLK